MFEACSRSYYSWAASALHPARRGGVADAVSQVRRSMLRAKSVAPPAVPPAKMGRAVHPPEGRYPVTRVAAFDFAKAVRGPKKSQAVAQTRQVGQSNASAGQRGDTHNMKRLMVACIELLVACLGSRCAPGSHGSGKETSQ
jgi:hypothetical protein